MAKDFENAGNGLSEGRLLGVCLVAAMGGLLFGYDWVVIGGAKPFYEPYLGLDDPAKAWEAGFAMGSAVLGCIGGAIGLGWLPDRFGRKPSLILSAVLFTVSALWTAFATGYASFVAARILGGVGIGLASNVSPVYIAEVSPPESRGRLVSLNQLTIVLGIIFAQLANYATFRLAPADISWRVMFGAEAVPAALFLVLALSIPESPRWGMEGQQANDSKAGMLAVVRLLFERRTLAILALGAFLAAFQQWCGINVVFNYAEEVFRAAGYDVSGVMFNQVITGVVNCVFTVVAMCLVDKWGRRGEGHRGVGRGDGGDRVLRDDARAGHVGRAERDFPRQGARHGDVRGGGGAVDFLFWAHPHLQADKRLARGGGDVLALRGDMRGRVRGGRPVPEGDEGPRIGVKSFGLCGIMSPCLTA